MTSRPALPVVFDLEFTAWPGSIQSQWSRPGEFREVVQIGAVRLSPSTLKPVDEFEMLIIPRLNPVLSDFFVQLTGITNEALTRRGVGLALGFLGGKPMKVARRMSGNRVGVPTVVTFATEAGSINATAITKGFDPATPGDPEEGTASVTFSTDVGNGFGVKALIRLLNQHVKLGDQLAHQVPGTRDEWRHALALGHLGHVPPYAK